MSEIWKSVSGRPGYEISTHGRMRSWRKRGYGTEFADAPHDLNPTPDRDGYLEGCFYEGSRHVKYRVHVLMLETFVGPRPSGAHQAAHADGNRQNNRIENLRWATPLENAADCIRHGNRPRGEVHPDAKLTEDIVRQIRVSTESGPVLAARYGVTRGAINRARAGQTWRHIAA